MENKILARGAEAIISQQGSKVLKTRIPKSYRHPILDEKLRKSRTRAEAKILTKLSKLVPVPKILNIDENKKELTIEYLPGKRLSDHLDKLKNYKTICKQVGKSLAKIHDAGIIHGDLTTSNMILKDAKVYFIDFGLGFHSNRIEDRSTDIHLIKEALEAKHTKIADSAFKSILQGYKSSKDYSKTIARLSVIEKRGRYKAQY